MRTGDPRTIANRVFSRFLGPDPHAQARRRGQGISPPAVASRLAALLLAGALACGCSRSEASWRRALEHPDPFERALAALALVRLAPTEAGEALPVLLETIDRTELELGDPARAALRVLAPFAPEELITAWLADPLATEARQEALTDALLGARGAAAAPLAAAARGLGAERAGPVLTLLARLGEPGITALAELALEPDDLPLADSAARTLVAAGGGARAALPLLRAAAMQAAPPTAARARELLHALREDVGGR